MTQIATKNLKKELDSANSRIRTIEQELIVRDRQDGKRTSSLAAIAQCETFLSQSAKMAHLGSALKLGYAIWDDTLNRDVAVSEELARIHGLTAERYKETVTCGKDYLQFVVPDDHEKYMGFDEHSRLSEFSTGIKYRITLPDGEIRHLHQRSQYLQVSSGKPTLSLVIIQDITETMQAELRLKQGQVSLEESEALLTQSVTLAKLGYAVWDVNKEEFDHVSPEWAKVFGYSQEEYFTNFRGVKASRTAIHPDDLERYKIFYYDKNPDKPAEIELRIVTRSNEIRHIHQSHKFVYNECQKRVKALLIIQDITGRIEREIELSDAKNAAEQASLAKSSFLAMMSHEIRTPLNAVLGALGLIESKGLDPSQRQFLDVGKEGAESLLKIINDILVFSKMEAGKLKLEQSIFCVRKAVDDVLQVLEQRSFEKNISLTGYLDLDVPDLLIGDVSRIRQVLLNLCSNAVRFTTDGKVRISLAKIGVHDEITQLRFQVEDTGCGVSPEDQEHLFEEFWGTSSTALGDAGSTGLGLPISKQLVEMMGGSIGFESTSGRGSKFWFELPLISPSEEAIKVERIRLRKLEQAAPSTYSPVLRGRVILAEDNPANQLIERALLENFGLHVDIAANGHEVIAALHRAPYDLVLMDINMPEMDGIEATTAIRKLPGALSRIPIIAMTAMAMPGDREAFISAGMDEYISKPISRDELHTCITKVLNDIDLLSVTINGSNRSKVVGTDASIFNANIFDNLAEAIGAEHMPRLKDIFLSDTPARVEVITTAAACGNCELVSKEAHNLSSTSGYLGAMGLAELARQLEHAARENDLEKIKQEIKHLPSLFEQTREKLLRV